MKWLVEKCKKYKIIIILENYIKVKKIIQDLKLIKEIILVFKCKLVVIINY
jgi:hypothetical protein